MHVKTYISRHPLLAGLGLFFLFIIISAVLLVFFITSNSLQHFVQKYGSKSFGREFTIGGPFRIDWDSRVPHVSMEKIRLANLPDSKDPYMLEIGKADFRIRVWKLLTGRLELPELTLEKPRLILEKDAENHENWDLPAFSSAQVAADAALPDNRHDFPVIGNLRINEGTLIYRDQTKGLDVELNLDTAEGEEGKGAQKFKVTGHGTLQKQIFQLEAQGGSLDMLRDSSKDYPLNVDIRMGPTRVIAEGTFKDPVNLQGIHASLKLSGNNMADLFYLTGIPLPPTPPYHLAGELQKEDAVWSYQNFSGAVGDSDLAGNLTYETGGKRGFLKADLNSNHTDLDDLGGFIGVAPDTGPGETAAPEQKQKARKEEASPHLLPDTPINLKRLRAADMDVALNIKKLDAPHLPFKGMNVRLKLNEGLLNIDPMNFSLADGSAEGSLTLDGRTDMPAVKTNFDMKKLQLSRFFAGTRFEEETKGSFGGHVELAGKGLSLADVLADSDGRAVFLMQGGKISLLLIEASDIDIEEATPLLLGKDKTTQIRCAVGDFDVNKGVLRSRVFILDTTDTNLNGHVLIDLRNETIEAALDAHPKDTSLLSLQAPIIVTGQLKHPDISLEPVETGLRAGAAAVLGAVLTPVASIIPFLSAGEGEDSDCGAIIAQARNNAGAPVHDKSR